MEVEAQPVVVQVDAVPLGERHVLGTRPLLVHPCLPRVGEQQRQVARSA